MTYQLAGMAEAWDFNSLFQYPSDSDILPDFPEDIDYSELMNAEGFSDGKNFVKGEIDSPVYPDDEDYMTGWKSALDNFFINEELFGKEVDNLVGKL